MQEDAEGEGNTGTVVAVRRCWWAFFGRVYWVDWERGACPVPYTGAYAQRLRPSHAAVLTTDWTRHRPGPPAAGTEPRACARSAED
ncbi:hypothetical protein [Streptomyces boncukensis]|uniref:Uncharacterized protein n=1 Tax=Streptomyces boncukensis TaxID=2711219 RepID=A0A6G4WZ15_9ACTN|nr:hypothetical protein [Streptomyces boncukensis]NGO69671.1 hypothetical protein [Streptomyces boncukensis]